MSLVAPHGGTLVNRVVDQAKAEALKKESQGLTKVVLSLREQCDLEMIAIGAFSPLTGFMGQADFTSVCKEMRLSTVKAHGSAVGLAWSIPVTLCPPDEVTAKINPGQKIALLDDKNRLLAVMTVAEKYPHDKQLEIPNVYKTQDDGHPGVAITRAQGNFCLAGAIDVINPNYEPEFPDYRNSPARTREMFEKKGWSTIVAFQTRNPIHRSHEYLTKVALEQTDGLMIHPLVGETKKDDIPAQTRMDCYKTLVDNYYNKDRTILS
ncbi:MAG TPA: hypothetical protein VKK61_03225, partial [Tepidisphaeraceae bacterium]|nr:hypothetical protein [Tepidisphaeraceae bacterium]